MAAVLFCDRVRALRALGYTSRQLRFPRLVLRCGGVCVPRQYARHAGIAPGGRRCLGFFARLVRRGHAARLPCGHNRAHVYHVHGRALEAAFGEDANRYRRAMSPALVVVRLMRLDAALMTPDAVAYAALTDHDLRGGWRTIEPATGPTHGPSAATATGPRRLPLIHPVGIDRGGATVFVCLVTEASPDRFRRALQGLLAHLAAAQAWALFVVFTAPLARLRRAYEAMVRDELESPPTDDDVQGLWRLFLRRREGAERRDLPPLPGVAAAGYHLFSRPRFGALYRQWMAVGDAAFEPLRSTAAVEAIADGRGGVAWLTLAHDYDHLVPLAGADEGSARDKGALEEEHVLAHRLNPGSQPRADLYRFASLPGLRGAGVLVARCNCRHDKQMRIERRCPCSRCHSVAGPERSGGRSASGRNRGVNAPVRAARNARRAPRGRSHLGSTGRCPCVPDVVSARDPLRNPQRRR